MFVKYERIYFSHQINEDNLSFRIRFKRPVFSCLLHILSGLGCKLITTTITTETKIMVMRMTTVLLQLLLVIYAAVTNTTTTTTNYYKLLLLSLSSSSSPLCRVFIHIFLKQSMSLGNTLLQLFSCYCLWCLYI
jgi:hypothetical protein